MFSHLAKALLSCLILLAAWSSVAAQDDSPDYDGINDMFAAPSGSGSGSGDHDIPTSTPSPPGNCVIPDVVSSKAADSFTTAFNQAVCHSSCLTLTPTAVREQLIGYPVWTQAYTSYYFSDSGIHGTDCLADNNPNGCEVPDTCPDEVNEFLDCKTGCEAKLANPSTSDCRRDCRRSCMDDCTSTFHSGCNVDRIPAPCLARCRRDDCEAGCTRGGLYIDSGTSSYDDISLFIGGVSLQPQLPPNVTNIGNTLHRVSTGAGEPVVLPIFSSVLNQVVPYSTVILRVTGPASDGSIEKFYVLDDSNEVDLDDFACQAVNISFALVTVNYGMSDFSPPLNFEVLNVPMIMDYPDQLTVEDISHTVEQDNRVGFFQYHLIHVSWNLPNNYQFATGYRLSLITPMIELCGLGEGATVNLENRTITEYTFQVSTRCSYILSVEVVPKDPSDEVVQIGILTGDYMVPTSSDIALNCDASPTPAGTYDITINVQLNDTFTPVVMAAIDYFQLFRLESDIADDGGIPTVSELPILTRINGSEILQTTAVDEGVLPLDPLRQYEYEVTVSFGEIPRLDIITTIQTSCFLRDLGHIPLPPPGPQDINILTLNVSALDTNSYPVLIEFNFVYEQGDRGESLEMFHVWFNEVRAPEGSDLRPEMYTQLGALEREDSLQYTVMTSEEMFSVYLQIRVVTANTISAWSDPVIRLLTVDETLPDPVTDQQFNITEFTYSTSLNPLGELQVQVQIEIIHLILRSVTVEEFQVCVNPEILASDEEDISVCSASITFNAIRSGSDASLQPVSPTNTILLPRLGVRLYIQVRAINPGDLAGNWSEPEIISVDDIPPPTQITPIVRELSSMFDEDGMLVYTLDMSVSWVAPAGVGRRKRQNDPVMTAEMEVTKYVVVVGPEEIEEPYGAVPMSSISRDINVGSSDVIIREDIDLDDPTNSSSPIIYVQMRSVAGGASGSWSKAIAIPVDPTTPEGDSSLSTVLGIAIPVGLVAGVLLFIFVFIVVYFACRQYKVHKSVKSDGDVGKGFDLWKDNYTDVHFIPEGLVEGKELVVDEWEIPTSDVIVENHLGEGAFGLVFKGVISAPLRNPKLSSKLRQTIGLPVAIKLLKETATNKERKDFWVEIDMMKKISEGYCNNIVNMVGCVTLQEPLCLITEFVPHGDLLDYLRNQRKKNASRNREEKYLRIQLEQQRKAYEDMKRQMEILQSAQSDAPGEDRLLAGGSGYADFPSVDNENAPPTTVTPTSDQPAPVTSPTSSDESPTADQPLLPPGTTSPYTDFSSEGSVLSPATGTSGFDSELLPIQEGEEGEGEEKGTEEAESGKRYEASGPSPYLESNNEYSHLDPSPTNPPEAAAQEPEEEEDVYGELGDLDGNDLMQFAYQIATGMEYLASINIVHRDLACRNILVGEGKNLKITDFGLSREVEDVYVKKTKGRLPLKWMALESIEAREFTTCSDVWSFGVVLWEIGTMGGFPYPTIQNQDLLMMLKQGYRLEKPDNCAPEVYDIMLECWQEHPEDRPTFSNLREKFSNLLLATTGDAYMELEVDNSKVYYTMDDEESRERRDSTSSEDSDDSTIKKPKNKKIEKPKWANTNAYAPMPSTFKDDHVHVEDEHYRVRADIEEQKEELITENGIGSDANAPDTELFPPHAPLSSSISCPPTQLSATPILLEDQMGIPLSFVPGEKPSQPSSHVPLKKTRTNPYVDDPATKQLLPDESAENGVSKIGSLTAELNMRLESGENITAL